MTTKNITQTTWPVEGPYAGRIDCQVCGHNVARYWLRRGVWPPIRGHAVCMAGDRAKIAPGGESVAAQGTPDLVTYEIYELVDMAVGNGTKQVARHHEHGQCRAEDVETIRKQRVDPYPNLRFYASYPARGPKPQWQGTLEDWIGRMREEQR